MKKISANLWFDNQAEEAAQFYAAIFGYSEINRKTFYGKAGYEFHKQKEGSLMTIEFKLEDFDFVGLNAGPLFSFNPSISFFVICRSKEEIQKLFEKLSKGGEILMPLDEYDWSPSYAWFQDQYGLSWQLMLEEPVFTKDKIVPLLFFTGEQQGRAEEAIHFYTSVFKNSNIQGIKKYGAENAFAEGQVMHAQFELQGQTFMAMDSAMQNNFPFNEAVSFIINCENQEEVDYYWTKLGEGGDPKFQQCGWLKDRFGVSWQVVPTVLIEMMADPNTKQVEKLTDCMMQMKKLHIPTLKQAFES